MRDRRRSAALLATVLLVLVLAPASHAAPRPTRAPAGAEPRGLPEFPSPSIRPWVPSTFDSLQTWAAEARAQFRSQTSDVIDSVTITPFNRVGAIAQRWISRLGREHTRESQAVESALDSLGFDTQLVYDERLPTFLLLVVRNPFRISANAVGFMYWFRGDRLFEQGVELRGGRDPSMRVWWTGIADAPYEWAIVDRAHGGSSSARFFLFRLTPDGGFWRPGQYEGKGPDLSNALEAGFQDVNGDGLPELLVWTEAPPDTLFETCTSCPKRLIEHIYAERKFEGFELLDTRMVPTPYSMFVLFMHLAVAHNRAAAARLLDRPEMMEQAIGQGWATRRSPGTWLLEQAESEHWPEWLQFRFRGPRGTEHFLVRFIQKDGRWIIKDWKHVATATGTASGKK